MFGIVAHSSAIATNDKLTEAQRDVLLAVRRHKAKHDISPSYDELRDATGITKQTVRNTLTRLVLKGYIKRAGGRYRNLIVTEKGQAA